MHSKLDAERSPTLARPAALLAAYVLAQGPLVQNFTKRLLTRQQLTVNWSVRPQCIGRSEEF